MTNLNNTNPTQADPRQQRTLGLDLTEENRRYLSARVNLLLDIHRMAPKVVFGLLGLAMAGFSAIFLLDVAQWELTDKAGRFTLNNLPLMPLDAIATDISVLGLGLLGALIVGLVTKKRSA